MNNPINFEMASQMLINWKKTFDDYLHKNTSLNPSVDLSATECEFGKWFSMVAQDYGDLSSVKNLDFQHKKLHQIAFDIYELRRVNDDTLPDWLIDEIEVVYGKIQNLLSAIKNEI